MIQAKIVAEKRENALSAREWADLELYLAQGWIAFAKSAVDADARAAMIVMKNAEKDMAAAWQPKDCTEAAVAKARTVSGLVGKALDGKAH